MPEDLYRTESCQDLPPGLGRATGGSCPSSEQVGGVKTWKKSSVCPFFFLKPFGQAALHVRSLGPQPGITPGPPAVEAQSLNYCTTRDVPGLLCFKKEDEESLCDVNKFGKGRKRPRVCGREGLRMEGHAG